MMQLADLDLIGLLRLGLDVIKSIASLPGRFNAKHSKICEPETGDILSHEKVTGRLPRLSSRTNPRSDQALIHRRPDGGIDVIPLDP